MPVEDFYRLGISLHAPVVDSCFRHQRDHVLRNPLPEDDVIHHCVRLHLGLHLDVEDLKSLLCCKTVIESGTKTKQVLSDILLHCDSLLPLFSEHVFPGKY